MFVHLFVFLYTKLPKMFIPDLHEIFRAFWGCLKELSLQLKLKMENKPVVMMHNPAECCSNNHRLASAHSHLPNRGSVSSTFALAGFI